jgi:hypothetical protein
VGTSSTLQFPQKRRSGRGISTKNKIIKKKGKNKIIKKKGK